MKLKKCRVCKKTKLKKLFSLGNLCFTGKFPSEIGLEVFKSTTNYFNGVNFNFGRGESDPVTQGE